MSFQYFNIDEGLSSDSFAKSANGGRSKRNVRPPRVTDNDLSYETKMLIKRTYFMCGMLMMHVEMMRTSKLSFTQQVSQSTTVS